MGTGLLRDRLMARMAEMGQPPDYVRLAEEVLGIRNAPAPLARRLVEQALVFEDRRDHWRRIGEEACARAPDAPGVYVFLDQDGAVLYVGKALRIRRRLRAHFAARRWRQLTADMARVADVRWHQVGSELEALLVEAQWIQQLAPRANVQRQYGHESERSSPPAANILVILPGASPEAVVLVATRDAGDILMLDGSRDGNDAHTLAGQLHAFFSAARNGANATRRHAAHRMAGGNATDRPRPRADRVSELPTDRSPESALGAIVNRWLKGRGQHATRLDASDHSSADDWEHALIRALGASELFRERLVFR